MNKNVSGGLKDIFSTVLNETSPRKDATTAARIVVHGNGNVIAPGGTVHVTNAPTPAAPPHLKARQ